MAAVDASAYSSGALFTVGRVDTQIGRAGRGRQATGSAGANVWTSGRLRNTFASTAPAYDPLPGGAGFRAAISSERADGIPTEDLGIGGIPGTPDKFVRFEESEGGQYAPDVALGVRRLVLGND